MNGDIVIYICILVDFIIIDLDIICCVNFFLQYVGVGDVCIIGNYCFVECNSILVVNLVIFFLC